MTSPQEKIYISAGVTRPRSAFNRRVGVFQEVGTDLSTFAVISLWGKFGGLHTCAATFSHIMPLPNIFLTRLFSKLRLKRKDFQEILRLPWAQEVPSSNLGAPTKTPLVFSVVYRKLTSPKTDLWNSRRQEVSIHKSFDSKGFAT